MIKPAAKELIKNVIRKNFQFNDENVIESSVTPEASLNAMKELHDRVIGENK